MTDVPLPASLAAPGSRLAARRALFAALTLLTIGGMLRLAALALAADGRDALDLMLLALFAITLPWTVIGFWNAAIGFIVMRLARDPTAAVFPGAADRGGAAVTASAATVAILACVRNEMPGHVARNLDAMLADLAQAGMAGRFHLYVLSDTSDAAVASDEEAAFAALAARWQDRFPVTYRRRALNVGYKAGNVRDFCERWGGGHEIAITLDADSLMPAAAMLRLVGLMHGNPRLGILQALVVGMPSGSALARIFQFGMRLGMRSYTIGSAWWQGDCGPYWGHNAALRLAPFTAFCALPRLPDGRHVLSHDQVEAVLMRRGGFDVRVLPEEDLGWEENPPTLIEFIRRDLRWCEGNMQYWRFLAMPGLKLISRYQLCFAVLMFLGSPAWIGLLVVGTLAAARSPQGFVDPGCGWSLLAVVLVMWFAPKIATIADVLARPPLRKGFGGAARFLVGVAVETVFFLLLSPIMWFSHTLLLTGMLFGRKVGWTGQARHDHAVPLADAVKALWPHTLVGLASIAVLAMTNPAAIPVALLIAGGLVLSIPLAMVTAATGVGRWLARIGLGRLPEETAPPAILRALDLPVLRRDA